MAKKQKRNSMIAGEEAEIKKDIRNKVNVGETRMEKLKSRDKGSQQKGTNFEFIGFVIQDFYIFLYAALTLFLFSRLCQQPTPIRFVKPETYH